jgi:hypothetical protein
VLNALICDTKGSDGKFYGMDILSQLKRKKSVKDAIGRTVKRTTLKTKNKAQKIHAHTVLENSKKCSQK